MNLGQPFPRARPSSVQQSGHHKGHAGYCGTMKWHSMIRFFLPVAHRNTKEMPKIIKTKEITVQVFIILVTVILYFLSPVGNVLVRQLWVWSEEGKGREGKGRVGKGR